MEQRQVNYDRELGREDRYIYIYIADWGERERMELRIENGVGFKRCQHWLILTDGLNQCMGIFVYHK